MDFKAVTKQAAGVGELALQTRTARALGPLEVMVEVAAAGICGTDLEVWNWPTWLSSRMRSRLPVVVGHEFCGFVRDVGSDVTTISVGDYVSAESHVSCGRCRNCSSGREHICDNLEYVGVDVDGGFAEYVVLPMSVLRLVPREIDAACAALLEPFALAVRAVLSDGGVEGRSVLVTGLGPLGLMTMAVAHASGAETVLGVETEAYRLQFARDYTDRLDGSVVFGSDDGDAEARIRKVTGGRGVDVWLDYSGSGSALSFGLDMLARGGAARLLGTASGSVPFALPIAVMKEINLRTFHGRVGNESWPAAVQLLADDAIDLATLITHRVSLEEYATAFELLFQRRACKVLIEVKV